MSDDMLRKEIQMVVKKSDDSIEFRNVPSQLSEQLIPTQHDNVEIVTRDFKGSIPEPWHVSSFSSLTRFHSPEDYSIDMELVENSLIANSNLRFLPITKNENFNIFAFPKGKKNRPVSS